MLSRAERTTSPNDYHEGLGLVGSVVAVVTGGKSILR